MLIGCIKYGILWCYFVNHVCKRPALARQALSCTHLAHHELHSVGVVMLLLLLLLLLSSLVLLLLLLLSSLLL